MRKTKRKKIASMRPTRLIATSPDEPVLAENIWDVVCDTPQEAEEMRTKTILVISLMGQINALGLKRTVIAQRYGVPEERLRLLLRGRLSQFTIDEIEKMTAALAAPRQHDLGNSAESSLAGEQRSSPSGP